MRNDNLTNLIHEKIGTKLTTLLIGAETTPRLFLATTCAVIRESVGSTTMTSQLIRYSECFDIKMQFISKSCQNYHVSSARGQNAKFWTCVNPSDPTVKFVSSKLR